MKFFKRNFAVIFLTLFIACSEEDPVQEPETVIETGVFVDSEVEGVSYTTETQSGITNSNGEYNYISGETVTFSVGDIILGSSLAGPKLSPISIASTENASIETEEVKNISAFLQSLDADSDPSNGITIEEETVAAISVQSIDFTTSIVSILGEIVAEVNLANDSNLSVVYPDEAARHLATTLGETYETEDYVYSISIPFIENVLGSELNSYYWVHEFDENGKLSKSLEYEKYPLGLRRELIYKEYNEEGQPTLLDRVLYDKADQEAQKPLIEITYTEDNLPESVIITHPNSTLPELENSYFKAWYEQFDEDFNALELRYTRTSNTEASNRVEMVFDEEGNKIEHATFVISSGTLYRKIIYTYTEWGDIQSETLYDSSGTELAKFQNFYREDRTLERQEFTNSFGGAGTTYYDENEFPLS